MGDISQYLFRACEHPELGLEIDIETPVESEPSKDMVVPAQITESETLVKLACAASFI